jgi:hypothetical protein
VVLNLLFDAYRRDGQHRKLGSDRGAPAARLFSESTCLGFLDEYNDISIHLLFRKRYPNRHFILYTLYWMARSYVCSKYQKMKIAGAGSACQPCAMSSVLIGLFYATISVQMNRICQQTSVGRVVAFATKPDLV